MNIFRILSSNDGSINEPNVSSFLAYLLDPNEDHGISGLLLQEVLNDLVEMNSEFLPKIQYSNKITDLSKYSGYSVNIIPELTVNLEKKGKRKRRDIDIIIEIIENSTNEILYSICLENKITDASINRNDSQLEDELKGLENYYAGSNSSPEIYIIYLTPFPSDASGYSFQKLEYDKKYHLYWDNHENSVFNKLIKIFNKEQDGLIDPINNQSSYLIKSFLSFIKTNFKSYIEERKEKLEKKNYGKPVIDLLNDFSKTLNPDEAYSIDFIRNKFSEYVLNISGIELHNATRNAHVLLSIVNEKNRGHYNVKSPDDERKNIFRYSDSSKKKIKLFNQEVDTDINIYYKGDDGIEVVKPVEINAAGSI
ncbi:PD-(D/E)XK nuclease family protein [Aestuariibaculum marinum]|uniref:PD-(D/E)XK nuclease family protein n=1 Tax=Aestuariibaculum marinum TaxID=2683592 RepID=A0A8J6U667_9FLAO|nr:PD-(D/E)XK nuclease family protein [Aestuariibaculum marinum]MBD0824429.1 PD-(D/E)XK nuclease family protein [Aestuariibaculum marinum]